MGSAVGGYGAFDLMVIGGMLFLLVSLSVASAAVLAGGWEYLVCVVLDVKLAVMLIIVGLMDSPVTVRLLLTRV